MERHPDWRERVQPGDLVLVIDTGGGTTDFSLIGVTEKAGELRLERIAVGEHILLGGDNMDLALAHTVAAGLAAKGTRIDAGQLQALWGNCRLAKEKLLDPEAQTDEMPVTILGKGSRLIGGTIQAKLRREEVETVLEGFFPRCARTDMPERARRGGLQEMGLPYAADPAITRHLARFLQQADGFACPTHVLFNGGVMHAGFVRERLMEVLNGWLADAGKAGGAGIDGRRPDARRRARGGLLWSFAPRQRRAHSRWHRAVVLRRDRNRNAGGAWHSGSGEGPGGGAVRHGGRNVRSNPRARVRADCGRTGRVPLLLLVSRQARSNPAN